MAHQNVLNTVQIEIRYFAQNNNAANILHARATGTITSALLDTLNATVSSWLASDWAPLAAGEWTANEIILTGLNSLFDPRKSYPIAPPIAGTDATAALPASSTIAVKADIGRRGKGVAGRMFWVGLADDMAVGSELDVSAANGIVTAMNTLNTNVASLTGFEGLCIPHLEVAGVRPPNATSDIVVDWLLTDLTIDVQKDRLPFHKKHKRFPVA